MNLFDRQITEPDDITDFSTRTIAGAITGRKFGSATLPEFLAKEEKICKQIRAKCEQQRAAGKLEQGEKE